MAHSGSQPLDDHNYHDLQERCMALLEKQELRLEATFNNLSLGETGQSLVASRHILRKADADGHVS